VERMNNENEVQKEVTDEGKFGYGTMLRTFSIVETHLVEDGMEVTLNIDLESGYELNGAKLILTNDDMAAYETNDVHTAVKYALGFFE